MHRYRTSENVQVAFLVRPIVNEVGRTRVEFKIPIRATFSEQLYASGVILKIPVPLNTANVKISVPIGKAKYVSAENAIFWK